jgi:hypothetical protein
MSGAYFFGNDSVGNDNGQFLESPRQVYFSIDLSSL